MSRLIWMGSIAAAVLAALLYLFVSCVQPVNPFQPSNTKIYLTVAPTSTLIKNNAGDLVDSVGNIIKLGVTCNLPEYIDSIIIQIISPAGLTENDTIFKGVSGLKYTDTLWYNFTSSSEGKKTIKAQAFIQQNIVYPTTAEIVIYNKPIVIPAQHTHPHLSISGITNIIVTQTCSLSVTANDSNAGQLHSFYVKQDTVPFAQFTPPFRWAPPAGFTGAHQALFKVTDTDSPAYFDTQTVTITVSDTSTGPHWGSKTLSLSGAESSTISLTLTDISTGDSLSYILMPGLPAKDTIINAVYSYAFAAFDTNNYYPKIIVKDKKGNADTMTIHLWASRTNIDSIPPVIKHLNPPTDSITVSANSFKASVLCKDSSGIASVKCSSGSDTFATSRADSVWSATITGLVQGQYKTVTFLATDMSARANKTALNVYIKYDSTMTDTVPPLIALVSPLKDTIINTDSSVVRVKCTDANGIASVVYSIGSQKFTATRSAATDSIFTGTVKGLTPGTYSTITITATDASTAHNSATITVKIKYDNDHTKPTVSLFDPSKDSLSINANSYAVKVISKDTSTVASVVYSFGTTNFTATKTSDSVWAATVSGLVSGALNKITVVATDASINANKDTLSFFIKYDPTMTDLTGPVFFPKNGPANNAIVIDSSVNIVDSIFDPSGVDSVYWTQNGKNPKPLTLVAGSTYLYALADTLHRYHLDTIVVYAQDKSTNHNKGSQAIILNYNVPPIINDTAVSTNRNVAKIWTLNALSVDGDPLTWMRLTSPSALSGAVTGTLPSVTFTPAANWSGTDSFKVQISDGHWSDTAKIKITVVNVNVAPSIVTPPSSATKNIGQSVTFSVIINADVNPVPSFVWNHNGNIITTATTSSYTIGSIAIADSGSYTVTVANSAGTITSQAAILTVNYAPSITTQPLSQMLYLNQSVTFTIVATGVPTPTFQWRKNATNINGAVNASYTIPTPGINDSGKYTVIVTNSSGSKSSDTASFYSGYKSIVAGGNHSLVLKTDGRLFAFGTNAHGQLGDGTTTNRLSPIQIMTNVQSMASSSSSGHSLILTTDGTLFACGYNNDGELGDGTTIERHSPVQIMTGVKSMAAGGGHSLILLTSGMLYACGSNTYGQLGDGTTIARLSPIAIMTNVQSISAGYRHSLILKKDGTLFGCGYNYDGEVGDGTSNNDSITIQIMTGVQSIAAGSSHSLILSTNGILFACGLNNFGGLGDGTTADRHVPVQIKTSVQNMAGGGYHSLILNTDGTLLTCGYNGYGQLGDNMTTDQYTPVQIMASVGVQRISAGGNHSLVLSTTGNLFTCGSNNNGQLGDGTLIDRLSPVGITIK